MITQLHIENFKSLEDFHLPADGDQNLAPLTVLVGLNGSGKSTLLQALDFIGQLMSGRVNDWLTVRDWEASDLLTAWNRTKKIIGISVTWKDAKYGLIEWEARYNLDKGKCTSERVMLFGDSKYCMAEDLLIHKDNHLRLANAAGELETRIRGATLDYKGSVFSVLALSSTEHPALALLKGGLLGLKSLELLSPHLMRKRAKTAGDVGLGGEKLSAFLSTFNKESLGGLNWRLRKFYPHLESLQIKSLRAGWKELRVKEQYLSTSEFSATQLNDGLLRIIGILSQAFTMHSVVLFDEIENGVNQQLVKLLMDFLLEISAYRQIFVTTHSPLILNFLPDEKAREGVIFLYKDKRGATHARRFFELKQVDWKLNALGPGEVFVDTDLTVLSENLAKDEGGNA